MKVRMETASYAIQRCIKDIELELQKGNSQNLIRRELMKNNKIPAVSRAYFNEVLSEILHPQNVLAEYAGAVSTSQPTPSPNQESIIGIEAAHDPDEVIKPRRDLGVIADERFATDF